MDLPEPFAGWFAKRGWSVHPHQKALLDRANENILLVAPTGAGKTLAGFIPSLINLAKGTNEGLHTLYVSPLKALAADIGRNLRAPVAEMGLSIRIEDRTGDTASHIKTRQRADPPDILLTTPESLALLLSQPEAQRLFSNVRRVVVDEIHSLAGTKRGDQLSLCLGRLRTLAKDAKFVALSATVDNTAELADWLVPRTNQGPFGGPRTRSGYRRFDRRRGSALVRDGRAVCRGRSDGSDQGPPNDDHLHQHASTSRVVLPSPVGGKH